MSSNSVLPSDSINANCATAAAVSNKHCMSHIGYATMLILDVLMILCFETVSLSAVAMTNRPLAAVEKCQLSSPSFFET
jgi:hypothetical protein